MLWVLFLAGFAIFFAGAPFVLYFRLIQAAETGRLDSETIRHATGFYSADEIEKRFGPPDEEGTYPVSSQFAENLHENIPLTDHLPQGSWFVLINHNATSLLCLATSVLSIGLVFSRPPRGFVVGRRARCDSIPALDDRGVVPGQRNLQSMHCRLMQRSAADHCRVHPSSAAFRFGATCIAPSPSCSVSATSASPVRADLEL